ncbi:MAG: ATP-binding cassette domain-containing protein [Chloroflexi bacterium]|nr:ATP-binding cassette domain-containing protein [Chloroflexota bacterium]
MTCTCNRLRLNCPACGYTGKGLRAGSLSFATGVGCVAGVAGCAAGGWREYGRARECLDMVGLSKWIDHRPYEMSGGQQQRVAIARAIANRPRLILADEATGELDSETAREILGLFQSIALRSDLTILLASHDSLVDEYVDRVLHLEDGQIRD